VAEDVIGGYRLLKHMATGQTSQVWEVVELASHRHFAMKLLLPEKARNPIHLKMLYHEAEVGKALAHPNIIKIVTLIRSRENPAFVMEFFPAGSLKARITNKQRDFFYERANELFKQAATALAFMNAKGWIHRDVKPDNFLANSAGELRLIDFAISQQVPTGFAKMFWRKQKAQGTPSYMSPEQIRGAALDSRADIYGFGACCYEIVTGKTPFRGSSLQELLSKHITDKPIAPAVVNPRVTPEFSDLVLRMLAKKKEDRPKDFHQVLMALRGMRVFNPDAGK
jgi:serine/threonine protein kinase